jgi:hypothetical protein
VGDIFFGIILYLINLVMISEFVRSRTNANGVSFSILLLHFHIVIGFFYGWFARGTDTSFYWNLGDSYRKYYFDNWFDFYGLNNFFIFFINYPFSKLLGLNFWTGTFLYSSVSSWAFILLFLAGQDLLKENKISLYGMKIWPLILLLPSLHFWSSGIGKDSLVFLFMAMFFYGARDLRKHIILVVFSSVLLYHVRPHMAFFVLLSTSIMLLLDGKLHLSYKILFFAVSIAGFVLIYNEVLNFLKIDEMNAENIESLLSTTSGNLSYAKSFVDMSSYPYPLKVFTFLYRPLFFDAHNFTSFLNSIENLICLLLTIAVFIKVNPVRGYQKAPNAIKIMFLTFFLSSIAFAGAMSNFGIMVRMKNMTFVYFLIFLIYIYQVYLLEKRELIMKKIWLSKKKRVAMLKRVVPNNIDS